MAVTGTVLPIAAVGTLVAVIVAVTVVVTVGVIGVATVGVTAVVGVIVGDAVGVTATVGMRVGGAVGVVVAVAVATVGVTVAVVVAVVVPVATSVSSAVGSGRSGVIWTIAVCGSLKVSENGNVTLGWSARVRVIEETSVVVSVRVTFNSKSKFKVVVTVWVRAPVAAGLVIGMVSVIGNCWWILIRKGWESTMGRGVVGVAPWAGGLAAIGACARPTTRIKPSVTMLRLVAIRLIILRVIP